VRMFKYLAVCVALVAAVAAQTQVFNGVPAYGSVDRFGYTYYLLKNQGNNTGVCNTTLTVNSGQVVFLYVKFGGQASKDSYDWMWEQKDSIPKIGALCQYSLLHPQVDISFAVYGYTSASFVLSVSYSSNKFITAEVDYPTWSSGCDVYYQFTVPAGVDTLFAPLQQNNAGCDVEQYLIQSATQPPENAVWPYKNTTSASFTCVTVRLSSTTTQAAPWFYLVRQTTSKCYSWDTEILLNPLIQCDAWRPGMVMADAGKVLRPVAKILAMPNFDMNKKI